MIPILLLNTELERTPSGLAYKLNFKRSNGSNIPAWIPLSNCKVERGMLWVAEWLMKPHMQGVGALIRAGRECVEGKVIPQEESAPEPEKQLATAEFPIKKGFFTVVDESDKHYTFKFLTTRTGTTKIGVLTGQNNASDYSMFGYIENGAIRFWNKAYFHSEVHVLTIPRETLVECFNAIVGDTEGAGQRYAMEYVRCSRCGAPLTTPESIKIGLGPDCAGTRYGASKIKGRVR